MSGGPITIEDGRQIEQDPNDVRVFVFDWDALNLTAGVTIVSSTFTVVALYPLTATLMTKDNEGMVPDSNNRKTRLRLSGGVLGATYEIANKVTTDESPAQIKERSFKILIQDQ